MSLYLSVKCRSAVMNDEIISTFGQRLRVRASGICIKDNRILLVGHRGLAEGGLYWCPPGGGAGFGEPVRAAAKREISEETGLRAEIGRFMFWREFLKPPLHAIELYFEASVENGEGFIKGTDPELGAAGQLIEDVRFMTFGEIRSLPPPCIDPVFHTVTSAGYLLDERNWPAIQKQLI